MTTHTNRNMGEPPRLDPFSDQPAADHRDALENARRAAEAMRALSTPPRAAVPLPVYDSRPPELGLISWSILLGMLALLVGAVVIAHRDLRAISARDAAIAATHDCEIPRRDGDMVVLTVRNRGGQLVAACQPITDWRSPERMGAMQ